MNIPWQKWIAVMRFGFVCFVSLLFSGILLLVCSGHSAANQKENGQNIVPSPDFYAAGLVYHRFGDNRYPSTNTPIDKFEEQLKYLAKNGFKTYTASALIANVNDSHKKVFITVDDGLKSFYNNAWPLLKKYKCKATVFVNTESVGWGDYMTWQQLKELTGAGIEIGSHSHKHIYFLNVLEENRAEVFRKDLEISEKLFMDSLGFVPKVYAYPYGEYDELMAGTLMEKGYKLAFAQSSGVWSKITHKYAIPRFPVAGDYVGMEQFKLKVNMKPLLFNDPFVFPIRLKAGQRWSAKLGLVSPDNLNGINCFFNNRPADSICKYKGDTIFIDLQMPSDTRRVLLTLTAQNKNGQWMWWSKLLVNPELN